MSHERALASVEYELRWERCDVVTNAHLGPLFNTLQYLTPASVSMMAPEVLGAWLELEQTVGAFGNTALSALDNAK